MTIATHSFEVFVSGSTNSAEEWKRALEAPKEELPKLDSEQKEAAKRFGISAEEYARGVLAGRYGEDSQRELGRKLGRYVEQILAAGNGKYRLAAVRGEVMKSRWVLQIETPQGVRNLAVPLELADDLVDSDLPELLEELKSKVLAGVGAQSEGSR